jgi:DNA polymerase-3 subunit alpha (Gram-positive type)
MKFKKQSDITPKQIKYLKDLIARYGIDPECEIESLTKNAASRMIDRIRFEYGGR